MKTFTLEAEDYLYELYRKVGETRAVCLWRRSWQMRCFACRAD